MKLHTTIKILSILSCALSLIIVIKSVYMIASGREQETMDMFWKGFFLVSVIVSLAVITLGVVYIVKEIKKRKS